MNPERKRVLIVPAGTEIGLEARESLAGSKHWALVGANSGRDHAELVFPELHLDMPYTDDERFADAVRDLVARAGIDLVVPAHDDAVYRLAGLDLGAAWVGPSRAAADILRFKSRTYEALRVAVPCPRVYDPHDVPADAYPVFAKPDRGQGSRGASPLRGPEELALALAAVPGLLVTELLPGPEYTVDCYTDRHGAVRYVSARRRERIRGGICVRAVEVPAATFEAHAQAISQALQLSGAWFFQMKEAAGGELKLLEVANRVSGTMGFQRERGINLLEAWLHERLGRDVDFIPWEGGEIVYDRALAARASWPFKPRRVYVDFDDTIALPNGKLNSGLVGVLFGLKYNLGARLVLITRHRLDIEASLRRAAMYELFDEVVHLRAGEPKSDHIVPDGSIFIDDSFAERREVWRRWKIPTFPIEATAILAGLVREAEW